MKRLFVAGLAIAFAVLFAGGASADTKIAVAGPITGQDAAFGEPLKSGAEKAI
jgi:branched-chain amino acid transport system substrate-binding protein